jgi:uncharacterized membrane protein
MMFGMVFFWVAIMALVVFAVGDGRRMGRTGDRWGAPSAGEILEQRFARGEISEEEFEARKGILATHTR